MFALISVSQFPADISVASMRCWLDAANDNGHAVTPSVGYLTAEHKAAIEGLADNDHRKVAYAQCQVLDMGEPTATGQFAIDKLASLKTASAPRRRIEGHGHV